MKKTIIFIFSLVCISSVSGQESKNLFTAGSNYYYFTNTSWKGAFDANVAYTRFFNGQKNGIRTGLTFFSKAYIYNDFCCEVGDVFDRYFMMFEASAFISIIEFERSSVGMNFGALYRFGAESQVVNIIDRGIWNDVVTYDFSNTGTGLILSGNYNYKLSEKLIAGFELGAHQIFQKEGTPFDIFAGLKLGFAF